MDAAALGSGAARGNAGFLCPTLLAPLPGPGMLRNAARALVDRDGSLRIRPGAVPSMARWGVRFVRGCTTRRFEAGQAALAALVRGQPELLAQLGREWGRRGRGRGDRRPVPRRTPGRALPRRAGAHGCARGPGSRTRCWTVASIRRLVPALTDHVNAGFVLPGNRATDPRRFVDSVVAVLRSQGVQLLEHRTITGFDLLGDRVRPLRTGRWRRGGRRARAGCGGRPPGARTEARPAAGGGGRAGLQRRSRRPPGCSGTR